MAKQIAANDPTALATGRNSDNRPPQFVGGSVDPTTGNLIPGSRTEAASGRVAAVEEAVPEPQTPTTKLATVDAAPARPKTDWGEVAGTAALNAGIGVVGNALSKALSEATFGGKGGSTNPLDPPVIAGGDLNLTGAGGSSSFGGGFDLPSVSGSSWESSSSSAPLPLSPSSYSSEPSYTYAGPSYSAPSYYGGYGGGSYGGDSPSGGGTVLCTFYHRQNKLPDEVVEAAHKHIGQHISKRVVAGYRLWAVPLVARMQKGDDIAKRLDASLFPIVRAAVHELAHRGDRDIPSNRLGWWLLMLGAPLCWLAGLVPVTHEWRQLFPDRDKATEGL